MLPIYKASSFIDFMPGGRTKPWAVIVSTEEGLDNYVVKIFDVDEFCVGNEVIGAAIAREFDLLTPESAYISFDTRFIGTLNSDLRRLLRLKNCNLCYGCRLIEPADLLDPSIPASLLERRIDIGTVFGFDVLIRNRDRNNSKPNLLLNGQGGWLIDHESGFEKMEEGLKALQSDNFDLNFRYHILHKYLKEKGNGKISCFDTFHEYLRTFNPSNLHPFIGQLKELGFVINENLIIDWFYLAKEKHNKFVELTLKMIV